ncbi:MAG: GMC family oxidoreductase [Polyangiales bacterium]
MSGAVLGLGDVAGRPHVHDNADVVIVGTGAAGATAARVLTAAGLSVVMLEEGHPTPRDGFRQDAYTGFKGLWRDLGFRAARGRVLMPILQGRAVGGTTVINGAIMHRLPEKVHASWQEMGAIDDLLDYAGLTEVFDQLDDELGVGPAPEAVLGRNNALMRGGVEGIGAKGNLILRNVRDCEGSARCSQGCPNARKQSMHLTYIPRSVAAGARVYAACRVTKVESRGGRAVAVLGRFQDPITGTRGPELRVEAKRAVLLAASAIQTPVLLHASGVRGGLVGRRFQAHPGTSVMGVFEDRVNMFFGATQGYETTHFWDERMKFESVAVQPEIAATRLPGFGPALQARLANVGHVAQWGVQVRAEAHGRVRPGLLGGESVWYDLTARDVARYRVGIRRLIEMMFAAGAKEVWPGVHGLPTALTSPDQARALDTLDDDPRRYHFIAAHLFGTAAMHRDPRAGVVRPDGRTHTLDGLYVVDSSLFPTNLGVNPQHTICAIAWKLAERIAEA